MVAEGGENEATLRPHSLPRKTSCQPVHCRSISIKRNQISIEPIEHNWISIESKNWGNIRLRFDCIWSGSIVESVRLRLSGHGCPQGIFGILKNCPWNRKTHSKYTKYLKIWVKLGTYELFCPWDWNLTKICPCPSKMSTFCPRDLDDFCHTLQTGFQFVRLIVWYVWLVWLIVNNARLIYG